MEDCAVVDRLRRRLRQVCWAGAWRQRTSYLVRRAEPLDIDDGWRARKKKSDWHRVAYTEFQARCFLAGLGFRWQIRRLGRCEVSWNRRMLSESAAGSTTWKERPCIRICQPRPGPKLYTATHILQGCV